MKTLTQPPAPAALEEELLIGSLFSGYGGLDLGVQLVIGGRTAWHVEFDAAPSRILAHNFPGIPNYGDITKVKWTPDCPRCSAETRVERHPGFILYRCDDCAEGFPIAAFTGYPDPVVVLTGGFPCQDVSLAGARRGMTADTRSGLWSHYARAIDRLRPSLVVIENVRGLLSAGAGEKEETTDEWSDEEIEQIEAQIREREAGDVERGAAALGASARSSGPLLNAFGSVLGDLAILGFDAEWIGVRAADAGAAHGRFRVFVVAWPVENADGAVGGERGLAAAGEEAGGRARADAGGSVGARVSAADLRLFPTPKASDGVFATPRTSGRPIEMATHLQTIAQLLPTVVANDSGTSVEAHLRKKPGRTQVTSLQIVAEHLLPTPSTANSHGNQTNSRGELLLPGVVEALLPTPVVTDAKGAKNAGSTRPEASAHHSGNTLADIADELREALLPTPNTMDMLPAREGEAKERQLRRGEGPDASRRSSMGNLREDVTLLPIPGNDASVEEYEALWDSLEDQSPFWKTDKADYWPAIERWTQVTGRRAPAPTIPDGKDGRHRLNPKFTEWMMGCPLGWITSPEIALTRNEALKACGNGVVPQQAALAIALLLLRVPMPVRRQFGLAA